MTRFLRLFAVLFVACAAASAAVSILVFHHVDLRFVSWARLLVVPAAQAVVLHWLTRERSGPPVRVLGQRLRAAPVAMLLLAVTGLLLLASAAFSRQPLVGWRGPAAAWSTWAMAMVIAVALALVSFVAHERDRRARLLGLLVAAAAVALACDARWPWLARLPEMVLGPRRLVLGWVLVDGGLFAGTLAALLALARRVRSSRPEAAWLLEAAGGAACAGVLVLALAFFERPYLAPPWRFLAWSSLAVAATLASCGALVAQEDAGRRLGRAVVDAGHAGVAALVVVAALPLALLPWRAALALGRAYGRALGLVSPLSRRASLLNLRRAYGPTLDRGRAARWTSDVFASLGQSVAEGAQCALSGVDADALCATEDPVLAARLLADPRPKIFVTGHFGSWELAARVVDQRTGGGGAIVWRRVDNPYVDALVRRARSARAEQHIDKRGAARTALRCLRSGRSVAILLDENGGHRGRFVRYFGRPASTHRLPALLSLATGCPIVLGALVRRPGPLPFLLRLAAFEPPGNDPSDRAAALRLLQDVVATFERWVREDPLQWRWCHWRWKTRPDRTEETYTRADVRRAFEPEALGDASGSAAESGS